jgi:hypothetical protein
MKITLIAATIALALAGPAFAQEGTMKMDNKSGDMKSGSMAMSADAGMKDKSMKPMKKAKKKMDMPAAAGTMNH